MSTCMLPWRGISMAASRYERTSSTAIGCVLVATHLGVIINGSLWTRLRMISKLALSRESEER
jgi:hypothetical protein